MKLLILVICLLKLLTSEEVCAIKCYECNSHYNPDCNNPINSTTISLVDCNEAPSNEAFPDRKPEMCSRVIQKLDLDVRVIRNCSYLEDLDTGGLPACVTQRMTEKLRREICICNDKDGCNEATTGVQRISFAACTVASLLTVLMKNIVFT